MIGMSLREETPGRAPRDLPDVDADALPGVGHRLKLGAYGEFTVTRVEWVSQAKGAGIILLPLVILSAL